MTEFLIEELTRTERLVLILFYYEECSYEKIAEVLEMATSAVRKMHEDLLDRIRAEFAPDALPLSRLFQYLVV